MRTPIWLSAAIAALLLAPAACGAPATDAPAPEVALPTQAEVVEPTADPFDLGGRELLIGTDPTYEPFESVDDAGAIVGVDPDLMQAICEIVHCTPVFQGTAWDGIFPALKAGEFDALMSAITILPERETNSDATFTKPYYSIGQVILARADDELITGVGSLAEAEVGVQNGTTGDTAATDAGVPEDRLRRYDAIPLAIQALLSGDIDCIVLDSAPAAKAVATAEEGALHIVGEPFTSEDYGILVPNDSPELLAAFNHAIDTLRAGGGLDRIIEGWLAAPDEASTDATGTDEG